MNHQHEIPIRVRYHEVDGQSRVHHAQYLNYFERGRVEMLRASGISYRQIEESGILHHYRLIRKHPDGIGQDLIVTATSELACIDRTGRVQRLPPMLQLNIRPAKSGNDS